MKKSIKSTKSAHGFSELVAVMARLRGPGGCPWDRHQTHESLIPYLFSEAKEVREAVRKKDWENLREELGDILLQVVFHAEVAREAGRFSIEDVVEEITAKLKRRHPHVFGGTKKLSSPEEVTAQWEEIKRREKAAKAQSSKRSRR